ncbi:DNA methyltransferase [Methanobacterium virus Drs3]|uniref:DNA (cytosine-5-)-methyltransferase n=1 Tax=Methanobacterium virus Drs3 TaxID=1430441 RepID=A0A385AH35_9CAUD|nr:DNA methyltransferase [Methanobacterium virus Drs3]AXN53393.1 hypothetical protein Drs3_00012 [Methanobacterium virus Drs3]
MDYFSMFSGIGGFEYGIKKADIRSVQSDIPKGSKEYDSIKNKSFKWECVGYSEIDTYAKSIYKKHYPNHTDWGDATKIKTEKLPEFQLLVAGFPCQAFSIAGKRKGFNDTRGTLFFEIARILKDKRPRHFLLENVAGLLSHDNGKTFQTILRVLTDLGYGVEWQVLNSKDFGVPQNRERVFIVGHLGGFSGGKVFPIIGGNGKSLRFINGVMRERNKMWLEDGKEHGRNFSQGQRVYSSDGCAATLCANPGRSGLYSVPETSHCLDVNYQKGGNDLKKSLRTVVSVPLRYLDRNQKNFPTDYSMCIDSSNTTGVMKEQRIRRLTPVECERLQGFPDNYTKYGYDGELISDTQRYICLGNAVTTTVISAIVKKIVEVN